MLVYGLRPHLNGEYSSTEAFNIAARSAIEWLSGHGWGSVKQPVHVRIQFHVLVQGQAHQAEPSNGPKRVPFRVWREYFTVIVRKSRQKQKISYWKTHFNLFYSYTLNSPYIAITISLKLVSLSLMSASLMSASLSHSCQHHSR